MNCHLSDRLPWSQLAKMYLSSKELTRHIECFDSVPRPQRFAGPVKQFVRSFIKLLEEFKATDNSTFEELDFHDPKAWGEYGLYGDMPLTNNARLGYYESLLGGYISLNLLIQDPVQIYAHMQWSLPVEVECSLGYNYDEYHPDHLNRHLRPAFPNGKLAPATPEIIRILRDHAARMFRCMYSVTGENKLLDENIVTELVFKFFRWELPTDTTPLP